MKAPILLLVLLSLLAFTSCHPRQSAAEGERFLQEINGRFNTVAGANAAPLLQELIKAEFDYRFTPEQRVRLKAMQLYRFPTGVEISDEFITEAEAEALTLGNDSLLSQIRKSAFLYYASVNDTANALRRLHLEEPRLAGPGRIEELNLYYAGMSLLYARLNEADKAVYWHLQTRRLRAENGAKLSLWHNQMSQYLVDAGRYDEALRYADSSLYFMQKPFTPAIKAYLIKGRILTTRGCVDETLALYATALRGMENGRKAKTYSTVECQLLHAYADLLHQNGRSREAIPLLEKALSKARKSQSLTGVIYETAMTGEQTDHLFPQNLLAKCYRSLGQNAKAEQYAYLADSLQRDYGASVMQNRARQEQTGNSNRYLTTRLLLQEQEMSEARLTQYILWSTIAFLLALLAAVGLWWRQHRRRLRQLFDLLAGRHALWLNQHYNPLPLPRHEEAIPDLPDGKHEAAPLPDEASPANHHLLYQRILLVMQTDRPFLDPNLDLVLLARLVGTNRTSLSTAVNQQARTSFSNWLAEYRINYLIEQMDSLPADTSPDQLCALAGFVNRSTFYRQFRLVTGLTPKQYVNQSRPHRPV